MSEPLNIMTEAEAKTKWCPFARMHGSNRATGTDIATLGVGACLGSACMAWRWRGTNINDAPGEDLYWATDKYGFCGLAGTTVSS